MNSHEFREVAGVVFELWPKWSAVDERSPEKSNWNVANQNKIFNLLKSYPAEDCLKALKKQSLWEPDATKPSWSSLLTDLRSQASRRGRTPEEQESENQAWRDTRPMRHWGYANQHRLDLLYAEVVRCRPKLAESVSYARKFHPDVRVWVCAQWDRGDRFDDFADDTELESEPISVDDQSLIPF